MRERQNREEDGRFGRIPAELVLKNGRVVNLFSGRIFTADVAVEGGIIAGVGELPGEKEIDLRGGCLAGLVDAHLHFESSMVSPKLFFRTGAALGKPPSSPTHTRSSTFWGGGMRYLLRETENVPADVYVMLPSCVPANRLEQNGFPFPAAEMAGVFKPSSGAGAGEVMDAPSVLSGDGEIWAKLDLCRDKIIDGHGPGLSGKELQAYRLSGVMTDHECVGWDEALRKLEQGSSPNPGGGSAARNLEAIVKGCSKDNVPCDRFLFCTDDKHLDDIRREGTSAGT